MKSTLKGIIDHLELKAPVSLTAIVMKHEEMDSLSAVDLEVYLEDNYGVILDNASELLQTITWEELLELCEGKD